MKSLWTYLPILLFAVCIGCSNGGGAPIADDAEVDPPMTEEELEYEESLVED